MTAKVFHAELWGDREGKYAWLSEHSVEDTPWTELDPAKPFYLFRPHDVDISSPFHQWTAITKVMPVYVTGVVTARDAFVIDLDEDDLLARISTFLDSQLGDREVKDRLGLSENYAWRVSAAREQLRAAVEGKKLSDFVKRILYRPFDARLIFWHPSVVWRQRTEAMPHMLAGENFALATTRQTKDQWDVLAASTVMGHKGCSRFDIGSLFPLYLYPNVGKVDQHAFEQWPKGKHGRRPNLDPGFIQKLLDALDLEFMSDGRGDLKETFGPEDVLYYIYAIFHCPTYRTRYAEFLKLDFPRVPITSDTKQFIRLCNLGREVMSLHLLESESATGASVGYPVRGSDVVEKGYPKYVPPGASAIKACKVVLAADTRHGRVYINPAQFFESVEPEVWEFQIGGYQVAVKWLKDRRARTLSHDDITRYARIVEALRGTIRLMSEIDSAVPEWPMK